MKCPKFQIFTLLFLLLFLSAISSCTKSVDSSERVINIAVNAKIKGMDPIYADDRYSGEEIGRVYEGLLEYRYLKRPFELKPNLAESMPHVSEDGLVYTFKIKKGVLFHDDKCFPDGRGRELTAYDFVYSLKRLADPKLQSLGWWILDGRLEGLEEWRGRYIDLPEADYNEMIDGLQALDRYTLQFKLVKPFPQFLYILTMPFSYVVPQEAVNYYGKEFLNHPIGTGPFVLRKFSPSMNRLQYVKNPNYRKEFFPGSSSKRLPLVDKLVVNVVVENQPRWLNFKRGRLDFLGIPKDNFESAITPGKELEKEFKDQGVTLSITPTLNTNFIAFNHELKLFQNIKLRRAISKAYRAAEYNDIFFNGRAVLAQSIVPPGIDGYEKNYKNPYRQYDIAKAKKLLKEAGYPEGKGLPEMVYDTSQGTNARQTGEFLKKCLNDIGIKVRVQTNPWPELQRKIQNGEVMMWQMGWSADYPDANNFFQNFYGPNRSPGPNNMRYSNERFNKLFEKVSVLPESAARTKLYQQMNRLLGEEVPCIFLLHRQKYTLTHGWLKNYLYSEFEFGQTKYLDVDLKRKKQLLKKL